MKKLVLFLLILPFCLSAQTTDNFSDGDFTNNPTWVGNTENFIVNADKQLQLNAADAGTSYLSVDTPLSADREWKFWLKLNFAPSGSNCCDIYLSADTSDLTLVTAGYYLHVGESGSNDALELRCKNGSNSTLVCRGTDGNAASAFAVAVKVTRDSSGNWTVSTDYAGNNPTLEMQGTDNTFECSKHFGFLAKYTSSNKTNFFFDDVYVGEPYVDNEAPQLVDYKFVGRNIFEITFDEALHASSLNQNNIQCSLSIDSVVFGASESVMRIYFADNIPNGSFQITINNVTDLNGNTADPITIDTTYGYAEAYSVVINEIMADPDPVVALPNYEYIELYNTENIGFNLQNWTLQVGTSVKTLPNFELGANQYVIICSQAASETLSEYGQCITTSLSVVNGGTTIRLQNADGELVHEVTFSDSWYGDSNKINGGWSLELINPLDVCTSAKNNWTASVSPLGGTPGSINSVFSDEEVKPMVESLKAVDGHTIELTFNQTMDETTLTDKQNYDIGGNHPTTAILTSNGVKITFEMEFESGSVYTLNISGLANCSGVMMDAYSQEFMLPAEVTEGQIIINEVMYNPVAPCVDYVELYNPTDLGYDLVNMSLGLVTQSFPSPPDTVIRVITSTGYYLAPHAYVVLSSNGNAIADYFDIENRSNFLTMSSCPSLPNGGGQIIVTTADKTVIDKMNYSENMQYPLLKTTKGVSLERISPSLPSTDALNWHSASSSTNYGTPGYENSVYHQTTASENMLSIEPSTFSPDNDGYNDVCMISLQNTGTATLNIHILTSEGREIRYLVKNELVGANHSVVWDGLDESGNRVQLGIYIVYAEMFAEDGTTSQLKKTVVVAGGRR